MVYLYAITDAGVGIDAPIGIGGASVRLVEAGATAAAVSDHARLALRPTEETLWRHEEVVEALMEAGAVLPVRFGTTLSDDDAVAALLQERERDHVAALQSVRGAVEVGVRALWEPAGEPSVGSPPAGDQSDGLSYLRARLARTRFEAALSERIHAPLAELARAARRRLHATPRLLLSGAYLVDRETVPRFRERVDEIERELDDASIVCTGPWPPYSFAPRAGGGA